MRLFFLLLLFFTAACQQKPSHPVSEFFIERDAYTLSFDGKSRQARWVYEYLTARDLEKHTERTDFDFKEDPLLPELFRVNKKDYTLSGFDRGHLCPAADRVASPSKMEETFYFSNISPQVPAFNRKYWLKVEKYVRSLTTSFKALHVYTGPLFLPYKEKVSYPVIGNHQVAVPTHFFKIIFTSPQRKDFFAAYIVPNEEIPLETPLSHFKTSLEKVEKAAGFIFK